MNFDIIAHVYIYVFKFKYKFKVKHKVIYPDHYKISKNEIKNLKEIAKKYGLIIITTEKDFLRLNNAEKKNIKFLKVNLK